MPLLKGGIFLSGGIVREWAFNYIAWQPRKLILFGCYKDYDYCEPDIKECIRVVDDAINKMQNKKPR